VLVLALVVAYFPIRAAVDWPGWAKPHTLMEYAATLIALGIGVISLIHFYAKKNNRFLFIGTAFIGTALLDGFHTVVTDVTFVRRFEVLMPSSPPSLILWSWNASRIFLGLMMLLSYVTWRREEKMGEAGRVREALVYATTGVMTLACFTFFVIVPLPATYHEGWTFPRPEEFVSAALFLAALVCYYRNGAWREDAFEHWVVLSLILGLICQALYMPSSMRPTHSKPPATCVSSRG
jgi:hypothetical protein